jgi:hypothetical protein
MRKSAPATALPGDGDKVATTELSSRSDFGREDRVVGCVSEGVGMGPRHAVIKEVMFSARYKGEGTLVFPWAFQ